MDELEVFPANLSVADNESRLFNDQTNPDCYESEGFIRFQYTVSFYTNLHQIV